MLWCTTDVAAQDVPKLVLEDQISVYDRSEKLTEPSGLSVGTRAAFWTVSDDHPFILGLDSNGVVILKIPVGKGGKDLEGVIEDQINERLLAVSERNTEIISVDINDPSKVTRHPLNEMAGFSDLVSEIGSDWQKNGLEGIAVDPKTGKIYVVKERRPRMIIEVSADLSAIRSTEVLSREAGLISPTEKDRDLDISGIAFDPARAGQWILSDTDSAVFFRSFSEGVVYRYRLVRMYDGEWEPLSNPEGIALSSDGNELFIISDDGKGSLLLRYGVE